MSMLQIGLTLFAGIVFVFAPYLDSEPRETSPLYIAIVLLGLICLAANVICFVVFLFKEKANKKGLILPGIRNMLLIPSALIASNAHYVGWYSAPGSTVSTRYDSWQEQFIGYAFALASLVVIVFTVVEVIVSKKCRS